MACRLVHRAARAHPAGLVLVEFLELQLVLGPQRQHAVHVPVRLGEEIVAGGLDTKGVLQRVDHLHLLRVLRIHHLNPLDEQHVFRIVGDLMGAGTVECRRRIVIVVHHENREIAVVREFGDSQGCPALGIDERCGIKGVAVHPNHGLRIERRWLTHVVEAIDRVAGKPLKSMEGHVLFGPDMRLRCDGPVRIRGSGHA